MQERLEAPALVVVRSGEGLRAIVGRAPTGFGSEELRSDVFFLKRPLTAQAAFAQLPGLREGIDSMTGGNGVLYFSRVKADARETRVQRVMALPR